jgi:hypothetical protein
MKHTFKRLHSHRMKEGVHMLRRKRLMGIIFFFVGTGMIIQFMMPGWGFLLAMALIVLGFWTPV